MEQASLPERADLPKQKKGLHQRRRGGKECMAYEIIVRLNGNPQGNVPSGKGVVLVGEREK